MYINQLRKKILDEAKDYVSINGWRDDMLINFAKSSNFKYEEIITLFPNGYKSLIQIALNEINKEMTKQSKKLNLIQLKTHERIKELIILRLKIMYKEKKFISKTFLHLMLPQNYSLASNNLYKTVDQIWFLAGDNSTDFNFYTKRTILSSIYTFTLMHFINNDNFDETLEILNKQLHGVSKIPKIKNSVKEILRFSPQAFSFFKKYS